MTTWELQELVPPRTRATASGAEVDGKSLFGRPDFVARQGLVIQE